MSRWTPHDVDSHGGGEECVRTRSWRGPRTSRGPGRRPSRGSARGTYAAVDIARANVLVKAGVHEHQLMSVTPRTAQPPMSWSKAERAEHAVHVSGAEVSHAPMSSLKDEAYTRCTPLGQPPKTNTTSVTTPVSHVEMQPYAASAAAGLSQASTAVGMLSSSSAMPATASNKLKTHRSAATTPSSLRRAALKSRRKTTS